MLDSAGVVQWQNGSFPISLSRFYDSAKNPENIEEVPAIRGLLAYPARRNPAKRDVLKSEKCNMSATRRKPANKRDFESDDVLALREMEQWGQWADKQLKGLFIHIGPNT